jgi:predicted CXXCH cytochrome family protein
MKLSPALILISAVLALIIGLSVFKPQPMLAPGPVIPAHAAIGNDCWACHTPLKGAASARCITCHKPAAIGMFSTTGAPLPGGKTGFHRQLTEPDCMACHSDHAGPALTGHRPAGFSHQLLKPAVRGDCASCHKPPATPPFAALHKAVDTRQCSQCHQTKAWRPASFSHSLLAPAQASQCATCHRPPADSFHKGMFGLSCSQCHNVTAWEPARFDHSRWFVLDRDHNAPCATCHVAKRFDSYTCYGCHEHDPARTLAEHREEGVRGDISNCVRCHRSAEGEGGEGRLEGGDDN